MVSDVCDVTEWSCDLTISCDWGCWVSNQAKLLRIRVVSFQASSQKEILVKGNISNAVMVIQMREITRLVIKMGDGFLKVSGDADMSFFQPLECIQGFSEICDNLQKCKKNK